MVDHLVVDPKYRLSLSGMLPQQGGGAQEVERDTPAADL
jgi:hypothetical protein